MKAIVQDHYGTTDQLRLDEVPDPVAGPGEVLVRVGAAGVDRGTWHVMTGRPLAARLALGLRTPKDRTPGRDVAGTVEALGEGVTEYAVGDAVYGTARGSFAELAVVPLTRLARRPANLSVEEAAAVPVSGVDRAPGRAGRRGQGRRPGARHRGVRRRRLLRRAARRRPRRAGHRRLRPGEGRAGALAGRRARRRPHDDAARHPRRAASTSCSTSPATGRCGCCAACSPSAAAWWSSAARTTGAGSAACSARWVRPCCRPSSSSTS